MDQIKEAFSKVKEDIKTIKSQLIEFSDQLKVIKSTLNFQNPTQQPDKQTNKQAFPTDFEIPTHNLPPYGLKSTNNPISTGNEGVPTNKQTNKQTNQHTGNEGVPTRQNKIENLAEVLESLDSLKREVRIKFKRLTRQEMTIFSTIYELEERGFIVDYALLSSNLSLSEASIRDYVRKLIQKGIPITKNKENNKKITLFIDDNLKKIASLSTISLLREI